METSSHRLPDPDLLERYVLGRLDQREREEVEELVRTSEAWRDALRREQLLAAGVRRLGRAGIRQQLSERLSVAHQRTIPWPKIAVAAAVMCIVVGVGIVNRWFVPSPQPETVFVERPSESDQGPELVEKVPSKVAGEEITAVEEDQKHATVDDGRRDKEADRVEEKEKVTTSGARAREDELDYQPVATKLPEPPRASDSRSTSVFWTQGQLLSVKTEGPGKHVTDEYEEQNARDRSAPVEAARTAESDKKYRSVGEVSQAIRLQQRPFATMDQARQQSFEPVVAPLIPTLIEQRGDSLYLTLYPDSPFSDDEMQTATAVPVTTDSLIVTVGGQQIGYRLPASMLQSQSAKTQR